MILIITKKIKPWRLVCISLLVPVTFIISYAFLWPGGFGFGESRSITSTLEKDPQGVTTKYIEIVTTDPGKTFWDWLSLLGVPTSLLLLGSSIQQKQQERMERQQEEARKAAKVLQRQKSLKDYFNKVTALLLDPDFNLDNSRSEQIYLLIRAETLAVLEELDGARKGALVKFLVESNLIKEYSKILSSSDLSDAKLFGIDLSHADLSSANLVKADLFVAILTYVNFTGANLAGADLRGAFLSHSIFDGAILANANLEDAIISSESQFVSLKSTAGMPYLCNTRLPESFLEENNGGVIEKKAIKCNRKRDCEKIPQVLVKRGYFKNTDEAKKYIEDLRDKLWDTD